MGWTLEQRKSLALFYSQYTIQTPDLLRSPIPFHIILILRSSFTPLFFGKFIGTFFLRSNYKKNNLCNSSKN